MLTDHIKVVGRTLTFYDRVLTSQPPLPCNHLKWKSKASGVNPEEKSKVEILCQSRVLFSTRLWHLSCHGTNVKI